MGIFGSILIAVFIIFRAPLSIAHAQEPSADIQYRATVEKIIESGTKHIETISLPYQTVEVLFSDGTLKNRKMIIHHGSVFSVDKSQFVKIGQRVVVVQTTGADGQPVFAIIDTYRLDTLLPFLMLFVAAVIVLSRWRGVGSIVGMLISLLVITKFIVPQIIAGKDPLTISIIGCFFIMTSTLYLAHGFSKQTNVALIATLITLVITGILSVFLVHVMHLTGLGSEDAYSLKLGISSLTNFKGLFLSGILIGALGVLDDVTTGLSASVFELHHANKTMSFTQLVISGLRIGREHVASLVNTLVLAYAGASLPMFMTLIINPNHYPLWTILNSEMIIEEIVRTLSGSLGLIVAVPLTTILAAWQLTKSHTPSHNAHS